MKNIALKHASVDIALALVITTVSANTTYSTSIVKPGFIEEAQKI